MEITIEQRHIEGAKRGDECNCPVARCLKEICNEKYNGKFLDHVRVKPGFVKMPYNDYICEDKLTNVIYAYDAGEPFQPGTYILNQIPVLKYV